MVAAGVAGGVYGFFGSSLLPTADARLQDHPKLAAASRALVEARAYMEHTPSDFRGHKAEAIVAINHALREVAFAAGETIQSSAGVAPIPMEHVHPRLWEARERIKEGRMYLEESREGFFGHKVEAMKWINETLRQLDLILVD
jgi:hypothetical protein